MSTKKETTRSKVSGPLLADQRRRIRRMDRPIDARRRSDRRRFLQLLGLGGAGALLSPFLDLQLRQASGQESGMKRLVLFTNGNGFAERNYTCVARSETDFDLSPAYQPLQEFKDDLLILSSFFNPHDKALHGNQMASLSCVPGGSGPELRDLAPGAGDISIDRLLARTVGMDRPLTSTAVGIEDIYRTVLCTSVDGPGTPFPAFGSPVDAFSSWFGDGIVRDEDATRRLIAREQSLLDGVVDEVSAVQRRLGSIERARLDQYLESLRALEAQLGSLGGVSCEPIAPVVGDRLFNAVDPDLVRAQSDTTFMAQQCGLTNVSHISILGREAPHTQYLWLGDEVGHHTNHHDQNLDMLLSIDRFVLGEVAHYWRRLKATPENGGTMADNTLVVYVNVAGGEHHRGHNNQSVLVLGDMDGYFRSGRYLRYEQGRHAMSDVYVSIANAMGLDIDTFGDPEICQGPLPGLT